jgi:hypothetical protein
MLTMWHPLSANLAITSPTSGDRAVDIVRSRTQTMEFSFFHDVWKDNNSSKITNQIQIQWVCVLVFCSYLEFRTTDKAHKPSDSECCTPSSEAFRFYKNGMLHVYSHESNSINSRPQTTQIDAKLLPSDIYL